jgi:hypothetical protein
MAVPKHLDEATAQLKDAALRIEVARTREPTLESAHEWLGALTDFAMALSDIQSFNNESVHEKLHEIGGRVGLRSRL